MPYFPSGHDRDFRVCKVLADLFCAILLGTFSIVFFGWVGGIVAFVVLEVCLIGLDWLIPSTDDAAGVVR
ncbi:MULTISPECIES: hypothetical protein [Bradyrhizobium]|jgi:hypothetical protein|uniref:Uncharacterized protein n=1 Tax=Bradyrhizobium ottawaense TaxID=931866 RepID=A0ABV4G0V5_9BRAD|nr:MULTISPECIES: hypothetical protein [Bradyrhizobium]MDA9414661.1 hypothetical protein [Bradyrhizobium sp. CCBAU 25360]MDA9475729.1 hypothetical protein [Bradyrhizobium sp. CCBAU 65884]MBR1292126.1 hypothetical protein [Bradyrhizobium ottawaense]MBR1365619.1 hypothetical protein [Bradyrhizobium ottawaense]MDA9448427.1 hypothetical protein [Bradyrhizobium sp. CCBAU 21360]